LSPEQTVVRSGGITLPPATAARVCAAFEPDSLSASIRRLVLEWDAARKA